MQYEGYKPDFYSQEYIEKLFTECYPSVKVGSITSYFSYNIQGDTPKQNQFYFGYLHLSAGRSVVVSLGNADHTIDGIHTNNPFFFDKVRETAEDDENNPVYFIGWKNAATGSRRGPAASRRPGPRCAGPCGCRPRRRSSPAGWGQPAAWRWGRS